MMSAQGSLRLLAGPAKPGLPGLGGLASRPRKRLWRYAANRLTPQFILKNTLALSTLADKPLRAIKPIHLERIKKTMVAALGFNNGVTDPRQKVVFHTLRHTFASWLAEQSVDLYSVKELMGHGTLAMTERYSHHSPDKLRRAVKTFEAGMDAAKARGKVVKIGENEAP
jgi:integrase